MGQFAEALSARKQETPSFSAALETRKQPLRTYTEEEVKDIGEFDIPLEVNVPDPSKMDAVDLLTPKWNRQAKTAAGLLTTFDPKKQLAVIKENYPDIKLIGQDKEGRPIVDATAYGGNIGFINAPGITARDLLQLGFQAALFTPAGKAGRVLGRVATTIPRKAAAVAAASGATQTAQDLAAQKLRGEEPSLGKVDVSDVTTATLAGGLGEAFMLGLAKKIPALKVRIKKSGITDSVRALFKKAAIESGQNADEVTDDVIRSFIDSTEEAVTPKQIPAMQGEKEFGISLTKGQRTGSQPQLSFEDTARSGVFGDKPQKLILGKEATQAEQARAAKDVIQSKVSKGADLISDQPQAGGILSQGIKNLERVASESVDEAYSAVGDASLTGEGFVNLMKATKDAVKSMEYVKSPTLAPSSKELLSKINTFMETAGEQVKEIKPQHIKQIELMRRTINSHISAAANNSDRATLSAMKRGFDDYLDNAVKKSLFQGDDQALEQLKKSRSLYTEYRKKFTAQPKIRKGGGTFPDREGTMIEKIISDNPTDIQVINSIYGAGDSFGNMAGKNMAAKFKEVVGKESAEWSAIRQAGFLRLIKTMPDGKTISGQKTFTAIEKAMKNRELMEEIFTPQEIGLFKRFAAQVKRTQPDLVKSRENPSGTAQKLIKGVSQLVSRLGFATGDPVFMAGGKGAEIASGFRAASRAKKSIRPFSKLQDVKGAPVGLITGASVQAEGQ